MLFLGMVIKQYQFFVLKLGPTPGSLNRSSESSTSKKTRINMCSGLRSDLEKSHC